LCRKTHKNRPDLLRDDLLILHDNAYPLLGKAVTDLLSKYEWEVLSHPPYSPDMSPPDFDLFPKLKEPKIGRAHV
jgi:histone-lysine N-methyltransferase SETMAR